jgi:hypothetical protein
MTVPLDPRAADKLARICGLFGSEHDGERASAAAKADKLVRAQGLTWFDVISPNPNAAPVSLREQIRFALAHVDLLSRWEHGFLLGIRKRRNLSDRQAAVLAEIVAKVRAMT